MRSLKLQVLGNIGQDATVSEVNGRFCINFSIAHNKKWMDSDGVKREQTTWVNCGLWKDKREKTSIAQYLKAGTIVLVDGVPEVRQYKSKDGQMVASLQLNVANIELAGNATQKTDNRPTQTQATHEPAGLPSAYSGEVEDDLPY